ncbi:MAG: cytochrome c6 PetJ [Pseudanabaenaceae cyanobacterium]|jgi:cytochrome c6
MKRIASVILLGIAAFALAFIPSVFATDIENGGKIFAANCTQCHIGGKNIVQPQKPLNKDALQKYGMYSNEAIIAQVTNGKNAMPAFARRLKPSQIEDVAAYVLDRADKGWK